MAGLCEDGNEPPGSLKVISKQMKAHGKDNKDHYKDHDMNHDKDRHGHDKAHDLDHGRHYDKDHDKVHEVVVLVVVHALILVVTLVVVFIVVHDVFVMVAALTRMREIRVRRKGLYCRRTDIATQPVCQPAWTAREGSRHRERAIPKERSLHTLQFDLTPLHEHPRIVQETYRYTARMTSDRFEGKRVTNPNTLGVTKWTLLTQAHIAGDCQD
ncbi:hypothetical protein ANN_19473 [Periplaneta americana]|uniref:Uncharacterized protein n=1 Tax=Periplaneta americana TaxID=6978 RepID=A0ABQ8SB18_PERAM|nr:hypothetical protein ANN_19473 [Periplaneta americana]